MIKKDFPLFSRPFHGKPLIYLDNAATTQKPYPVIEAMTNFYSYHNSNIHRGVYTLAEEATALYEKVRSQVADFIGARHSHEIVFTKGATESINIVAQSWGYENLQPGDEILLTQMEHHANLLPWQHIAQKKDLVLKFIPVLADGTLHMDMLDRLLTARTKLVSIVHVSHVLGTCNDIHYIIKKAHSVGARVLIDAAQSVAHKKLDIQELGADFLVFSGHKMLGPTGVGVLYIAQELHNQCAPYQFGGGMVIDAAYQYARYQDFPYKLEAGTPPIAQVVGLGAAITYLQQTTDFDALQRHEAMLLTRCVEGLQQLPGVLILGPVQQLMQQGSIVSFVFPDIHAHDVAAFLDNRGICVRAGHHCARPFAKLLDIDASVRVSFYGYNTQNDVDVLLSALQELVL